jgi:hypothetical protein
LQIQSQPEDTTSAGFFVRKIFSKYYEMWIGPCDFYWVTLLKEQDLMGFKPIGIKSHFYKIILKKYIFL